jgi:protein-L-isoaspartate(D-aspartate) O-methyltransferase
MASWRSGYAEDCKSSYGGSIPSEASIGSNIAEAHQKQHSKTGDASMVQTAIDYAQLRRNMVDSQLRTTDVNSLALLDAVLAVPRELFVPTSKRQLAYVDMDMELGEIGAAGRYLTNPCATARLLQLADIGFSDVVLDVGGTTGYTAAVASKLASSVLSLEQDQALSDFASAALSSAGCDNVVTVCGLAAAGLADEAPFDVIIVNGAVDEVPQTLFAQLREGGRLVVVEGEGNAGVAKLYGKHDGHVSGRKAFNVSVKRLPGFSKEPAFVL